ncbi:MAG TPA: methyltransferase domain-containing protein [Stellaceae bacterium]|nr:methyltransferase domain-containing protein [Stellaceae bacterium]
MRASDFKSADFDAAGEPWAPGEWPLLLRRWLRHPLSVGELAPTSRWVAQAVAARLELRRPGAVVELGAGTGSLTRGLLAAGCPPNRLVAIELDPEFAALLRRRFPGIAVIAGDAGRLAELLATVGIARAATVVSSLPIRWFPREVQTAILQGSLDLLGPGGSFHQLTNMRSSPLRWIPPGVKAEPVCWIARNFLPIKIWRYRREGTPA